MTSAHCRSGQESNANPESWARDYLGRRRELWDSRIVEDDGQVRGRSDGLSIGDLGQGERHLLLISEAEVDANEKRHG